MHATRHLRPIIAALALAGVLTGCAARTAPPAPVELRGLTGTAPPPRSAAGNSAPRVAAAPYTPVAATALSPRGGADGHLVGRGETLYGVARQYDVPVRALIDANNLQPPYQLVIGQRLAIPQQRTHTVVAGDTLYSISRRYGVDMSEVTRLNDIQPPYAVKLGEKLLLPEPVMVASASPTGATALITSAPSPASAAVGAPAVAAAPLAAPGGVAAAAPPTGVAVATTPLAPPASVPVPLSARPGLAPPASVPEPVSPALAAVPSMPLPDPVPGSRAAGAARREEQPKAAPAAVAGAAGASAGVAAAPPAAEPVPVAPAPAAPAIVGEPATPLPVVPAEPPAAQKAKVVEPPPPPPRASRTFLWPLRGRVLATYGEMGGGQHNDGINIAATRGTAVHAAENGVVVYAGNEIRGFGNLLLIRHADGYMTAYAHNDELLVQRGDVVRRGQVISRVGSTGNVSQPQLHFEVRKGTQAIDPESVLGNPAQASAG